MAGPTSVTWSPGPVRQTYLRISAVHVHGDFSVGRPDETPLTCRPGAGAGAGAARLGDAGAAFVDAHRDGVGSGPGSMISRLTLGHRAPSAPGRRRPRRRRRRRRAGCRALRWRDRPHRVAAERGPAVGRRDRGHRTHANAGVDGGGSSVGANVTRRKPASVSMQMRPLCVRAATGERLGEAADAVAAHLGASRRRCTAPCGRRVARLPTQRDRRRRSPRRRSHTRRASAAGRTPGRHMSPQTRKSLPRPWCLVRVRWGIRRARLPGRAGSAASGSSSTVDPAYAGVTAEPPLLADRELPGAGDRELDRLGE